MSSTSEYFKFFFQSVAQPPTDFNRAQKLQLTQYEVNVARLSKPLNTEDHRSTYLNSLTAVKNTLADQPDQDSYQALTRMTPTIQDLMATTTKLDKTKSELISTYEEKFKKEPYSSIIEMHRTGRSTAEIQRAIDSMEATKNRFAKDVENYELNAQAAEARLESTSTQYVKEAKALTGSNSLIIPTPRSNI